MAAKNESSERKFISKLIMDGIKVGKRGGLFENNGYKYSPKEDFTIFVASSVATLERSLDRQAFFPHFLSSFSIKYESKGFSRVSQFIYHIEGYLSEAYIFNQRFNSFLRKLKSKHQKRADFKSAEEIEALIGFLDNSMKSLINFRGAHVHRDRFHLKDEDLSQLETIDEAMKFEEVMKSVRSYSKTDMIGFKAARSIMLSKQRIKWKKAINDNNKALRIISDEIYKVLREKGLISKISASFR